MMKKFIGTKIILAVAMTLLDAEKHLGRKIRYEGPTDEEGNENGYLVEYEQHDNMPIYQSWSPKSVFEKAYRQTDGMNFGLAIEALKKGKKVCRGGWNGKGMYLLYVHEHSYSIETQDGYKNANTIVESGISFLPWIGMKTADDKFVPWLASQTDMLADDWLIIADDFLIID